MLDRHGTTVSVPIGSVRPLKIEFIVCIFESSMIELQPMKKTAVKIAIGAANMEDHESI